MGRLVDALPTVSVAHQRNAHALAAAAWFACMPAAILTGWIYSVAFVSVCSIYANFVGHVSAWQAARAEQNQP